MKINLYLKKKHKHKLIDKSFESSQTHPDFVFPIRKTSLCHGNPSYPPQCHPPQEIRPYDQGLLTIGFP